VTDHLARVRGLEQKAEETLDTLERENRWEEALGLYRLAGAEVDALDIPREDAAYADAYREAKRVRAYLYLREANALRALGRAAEAAALGDKELESAMASRDSISIARAMFSLGATCLASGRIERGLKLMDDARPMFEYRDDDDHRQGLGWWYIIQADIRNAGIVSDSPQAVLALADKALDVLRPLKNWPGLARAHAARALAFEELGDPESARLARAAQTMAEATLRLQDQTGEA
jgi:tetratricopeptide (TPR) repeat protein